MVSANVQVSCSGRISDNGNIKRASVPQKAFVQDERVYKPLAAQCRALALEKCVNGSRRQVQARQRDMRVELATLWLDSARLANTFQTTLQMKQRFAGYDAGVQQPRHSFSLKNTETINGEFERDEPNTVGSFRKIVGAMSIDLADIPQGQV